MPLKGQTVEFLKQQARSESGDSTAVTVLRVEEGIVWDTGWKCWVDKDTLQPVQEEKYT